MPAPGGSDVDAMSNQRTRLQIEVFQLDGPPANLAKLDVDQIAAGTPADILARLAELGQARLLHRLDTRVDLGRQMTVRASNRVPVVQDITKNNEGQPSRSVSYNDMGLSVSITGAWTEDADEAVWARLNCELEWSSVCETSIQVSEGVNLPAFGQFKFNQPLNLRSGESVTLLASQQPIRGKTDDRATLGMVRLTLIHLNDQPRPAAAEKQ